MVFSIFRAMTRPGLTFWVGCAAIVVCAGHAAAQDDRRVGLLMAYPSAVGVQWDVFDRFAVRADGSYERYQSTYTIDYSRYLPPPGFPIPPPRTSTSTAQRATLGVLPLFVIGGANPLKMYVGPRVGVAINRGLAATGIALGTVTATLVLGEPDGPEPEPETQYDFDAGARFGASYRLVDRFAMFGEGGFDFTRNSRSRPGGAVKSSSVGLRVGVGGILYF